MFDDSNKILLEVIWIKIDKLGVNFFFKNKIDKLGVNFF